MARRTPLARARGLLRTAAAVVCASLSPLVGFSPTASAQTVQEPPRPTFKSGVDIVEAEATITDSYGIPVTDLVATDFQLLIDGKPRPISSVINLATAAGAVQQDELSGRPQRRSGAADRLFVFVFDESHLNSTAARRASEALDKVLEGLDPADRVALAVIPSGRTINFNASRDDIHAALRKIVGRSVRSHGYYTIELNELFAFEPGASPDERIVQQRVVERECPPGRAYSCELELRIEADFRLQEVTDHTQSSVRFLLALLQELAVVSGPKTLVLISEGLPMKSDSGESRTVSLLSAQSAASRVTIYSVLFDPGQVDVAASRASSFIGRDQNLSETPLRDLASLSGGTVYRVVSRAEDAFGRLVRELSAKYVLTFPVLPEDRDGKAHRIQLTTTKRNLTIHSRSQFIVNEGQADVDARFLQSALRSQFANSLAVKVGTYAIRDADVSKIRLLVSVDLPDLPSLGSKVTLAYQLMNRGKAVGGDARTVSIERDRRGVALPISWIAFQHLSPGDYQLHLSAAVGPEQVGSVTRVVQARLHDVGRFRVSDLFLASEAPNPIGPFPVPADLAFGGDSIVAGLEIYERSSREADQPHIEMEILPIGTNTPLMSMTAVSAPSGTPTQRFARATLPISALPLGDYVVRAVVKMHGQVVGSVTCGFRRTQP
jgi:VWFA-related protein